MIYSSLVLKCVWQGYGKDVTFSWTKIFHKFTSSSLRKFAWKGLFHQKVVWETKLFHLLWVNSHVVFHSQNMSPVSIFPRFHLFFSSDYIPYDNILPTMQILCSQEICQMSFLDLERLADIEIPSPQMVKYFSLRGKKAKNDNRVWKKITCRMHSFCWSGWYPL